MKRPRERKPFAVVSLTDGERRLSARMAKRPGPKPEPKPDCANGCGTPGPRLGLCDKCYQQKRKVEQPTPVPKRVNGDLSHTPLKIGPFVVAENYFGPERLRKRGGCWYVDGTLIQPVALMRAVNAGCKAEGTPQPLTASPEWLV